MATTKRTVEVQLSTNGLDAQGRPQRVPLVTDQSGNVVPMEPIRNEPKIGRNEPCPCGSGKKYKHCHGQVE